MKNRKMNKNDYGVSETIGTILMVVITITLAGVLLFWIGSQEEPTDKSHVDLIADMELQNDGCIINIFHRGGEALSNDSIVIYIDIDDVRTEYNIKDAIEWQDKSVWQAGETWSIFINNINTNSEVYIMVINTHHNEILLKGLLQNGLTREDKNAPIITMTWCDPETISDENNESFKVYALIIDPEDNLPTSGSVTVNTMPINGSEAEPLTDLDENGKFESKEITVEKNTPSGDYFLNITATDYHDNIAKSSVHIYVGERDLIKPTIEIIQPEINSFNNRTPFFKINYHDNQNGSGIDMSSISLEIDGNSVFPDEDNITESQLVYSFQNSLYDGLHEIKISLRDNYGNEATSTLAFITGGYTEIWNTEGSQYFTILNQKGEQTTNFTEGEIIRIRVTSSILENAENVNKIMITGFDNNSKIINDAFAKITNTYPHSSTENCFATLFDAPEEGFYTVKMELEDIDNDKFVSYVNITVGNPSSPYLLKTYNDILLNNETAEFNSSEIIYLKIIAQDNGDVSESESEKISIDDYLENHIIDLKPGNGCISEIVKEDLGDYAYYTFNINLSQCAEELYENENWYTLNIKGLKNSAGELIFKGAIQLNILNVYFIEEEPDLKIDENDISISNETLTICDFTEIFVSVHNIGNSSASNIKVGFWENNDLIGTKIISYLDLNDDEEISLQWSITETGTRTIMVLVDPDYEISEESELNNLITFEVFIREPILLVDDDDGSGEFSNVHIEDYWTDILDSEGYTYSVYTVGHGENGPNYNYLKNYKLVIWFTGRDNAGDGSTLTVTDQNNLAMYLENNGNLWVISQSLLYNMCGNSHSAPLTNSFAHQYLKVYEALDDEDIPNPLIGIDGDPITDGISYVTSSSIFSGDDYADDIILEPEGDELFIGPFTDFGGVRYGSETFNMVFFPFEFTFIVNFNDRVELANKVLSWLGINLKINDVGVDELDCRDTLEYNQNLNISAKIKNYGIDDQNNFEVSCEIKASNESTIYNDTKLVNLTSENDEFIYWNWIPNEIDDYTIIVTTSLLNDQNNSNNEISKIISVVPYLDDFETDNISWSFEGFMPQTIFFEDFENGYLNNWEFHGLIFDEIVDTWEFDTNNGETPDMIKISDEIIAIVYEGPGEDGFLKTVEISLDGVISNPSLDEMEFDTEKGKSPKIIQISGDIYAIAYEGYSDDGYICTVEITSGGIINHSVIDLFEFDTNKGKTPEILQVSGDIYAVVYEGEGDDGYLCTIEISANGLIENPIIDSLEFDVDRCKTPKLIKISEEFYAIVYEGYGDDGFLKTVRIQNEGNIIDTIIDSIEYDSEKGKSPNIVQISSERYAITYAGQDDDGFIKTLNISIDGTISDTIVDSLEFDTDNGKTPNIFPISNNAFAVIYSGNDNNLILKKIEIETDGNINYTIIDTITLDSDEGTNPEIIKLSDNIFGIIYDGKDDDGFINTIILGSGNLDSGFISISDSESYEGQNCVKLFGDGLDNKETWIQRTVDLEGMNDVYLSWYWHDEDLESSDYAYLSVYDGTWHNDVITLWDGDDEDHSTSVLDYENVGNPLTLRLDEDYNMINGFKIRFGSWVGHEENFDCLLIDNIKLTSIGYGNLWHKTTIKSNSGNSSYWCGDENSTQYIANMNNSLISESIDLTDKISAELSFWHYYEFEDYKDGGIVEISIDNGNSWNQITSVDGYDGIIDEPTNPLDGKQAFCTDSETWLKEVFDISAYVGNEILIRFKFGSGSAINDEGWYIDDFSLRWGE